MAVNQAQRKFPRYETDVRISFRSPYDFRTPVDFKVDHDKDNYAGISKNISVTGLCFESNKILAEGDYLFIELHLPRQGGTIKMEGEVRWSRLVLSSPGVIDQYLTGVEIKKVEGEPLPETVYFDEQYQVTWSQLLEQVLGNFARLHKKTAA